MDKHIRKLVLLLIGFIVYGCSSLSPEDSPLEEIRTALHTQKRSIPSEPSQEVKEALWPSLELALPASNVSEESRFDIAVEQVAAREFFVGLVQGTPYNIIVHPTVAGQISLRLTQVTIPEVLEAIHDLYGYEFEETPYGFKILPFGLRTEVFKINYLNVQRTGNSETRVSAGQVSSAGPQQSIQGTTTGTTQTPTAAPTTPGTTQGRAPGASVSTKSEADFWKELQDTLKMIIGDKEGRTVAASPQSGVVLVRAMPDELRSVRAYLDTMQLSIQRQVILEAKILEVELKDTYRAGIDWAVVMKLGHSKRISIQQGIKSTLSSAALLADNTASKLSGIFSAAFNSTDFDALIELLETQGHVQVLSSPQVSTVNNQKAVIRVGNDNFFITNISFQSTGAGTEKEENTNINLTPFFSGIALDVTPQVSETGHIILHVHPSVSEVKDEEKKVDIRGKTVTLPLAASSIRESDSIVRAKSGEIVVIGGLIQNLRKDSRAEMPYLSKIPYMGALFRQTNRSTVKNELVILLRPVVVEDDTFEEVLRHKRKRFDSASRRILGG
ncbi:MAG: pilus (MSHA type) biogenesis protein MshL [Gammaproteobacteria bacterium]|nr:pilus (MSHA type) biogenesis protein MshL [Gammaproteobacteria bacterium]